ncbi:putative metalloprotease with PDZ domain [Sphingomonas zeicaulis]|uniref:M61 family metallopeptidase n=1 Tax=Sphingomonas zeicaulis TaxID=1632740 RepID=UPI003D1C634D
MNGISNQAHANPHSGDPHLPRASPQPAPVPQPADDPYFAPLRIEVDATDVVRRIYQVRQTIPVSGAEPTILLYPKWLPGYHAPQASIELLAGLVVSAAGEQIEWKRHPVTVNAFHIEVPAGTSELVAEFQFLTPTDPSQGRVLVTPEMLCLQWNSVVLYPAGHYARQIEVDASLRLPERWQFATALEVESSHGAVIRFKRVTLDMLVDSPLIAGRHFQSEALDERGSVRLNMVSDAPEQLAATRDQLGSYRNLVIQADCLFGSRHFRHYDFLLGLSNELGSAGIEHHQSCEAITIPDLFTNWEESFVRRDAVAHEYVHSWNGKHRRGADSWSPCFELPIRNSLMWVYEGLTQYWGQVLSARSGLWTAAQARDAIGWTAAAYDVRPGSRWRPMIDTTRDPIIAARAALPWTSWQRSEDYYSEGALMWLDVDTRIRQITNDERSLDDFARAFFGQDGLVATSTYVFEDVVETLAVICPFDWRSYLDEQITCTHPGTPLDGIGRGGYRLVYRDHPNGYEAAHAAVDGRTDLTHSLGITVTSEGRITDVLWDGPAFQAGLIVGAELLAIDGRSYTTEVLRQIVAHPRDAVGPELLVKVGHHVRSVTVVYGGGLRHPHLERVEGISARLDDILRPL